MATTTNYGWTTPNDTDLVKDGAAAIRTLGSSIDTTTKNLNPETTTGDIAYRSATANTNTRLAIGSTGQVLTVAGGVPVWADGDDANAIQNSIVDAKGDIIAASADNTPARLAVGTNDHRLVAASGEATGLKYVADTQNTVIDAAGDLLYGTAADTVARLGIGTAGQVLQVNSGATAPEWAAPASGTTFAGCYLYNSTNTTVASGTYTDLTFNSELYDTDGFHSTATNTDRITIPAGKAGYYLIMSMIQYDGSSTTGIRTSNLVINGSGISGTYSPGAPATATTSTYHVVRYLAVGDYVVLSAYQTSTTTITLNRDQNNTFLSVAYLGA